MRVKCPGAVDELQGRLDWRFPRPRYLPRFRGHPERAEVPSDVSVGLVMCYGFGRYGRKGVGWCTGIHPRSGSVSGEARSAEAHFRAACTGSLRNADKIASVSL